MQTGTYTPTHPASHLKAFYQTHEQLRDQRFDGLIITGAPIETLPFEEVKYWAELQSLIGRRPMCFPAFMCVGARRAGLNHFYDVPKYELPAKQFGIYDHKISAPPATLCAGSMMYLPCP